MKTLQPYYCISVILLLAYCSPKNAKEPILLADREAPLGRVTLKIYEDRRFEFISGGTREKEIFPGTVTQKNDTLYFAYEGKIPKAGTVAVVHNGFVNYISGAYEESLEVKHNALNGMD